MEPRTIRPQIGPIRIINHKILPPSRAFDHDRVARFERDAEAVIESLFRSVLAPQSGSKRQGFE